MTTPMSPAELLAEFRALWKPPATDKPPHYVLGEGFALALLTTWRDAHGRAEREKAFALGFAASGEGYNGEYPIEQFEHDPKWVKMRDAALQERPHDE